MSMPFRNTDRFKIYPVNHVTSIIEDVAQAEAAVQELDKAGFGDDLWYARGEEAIKMLDVRGDQHGPRARFYRALQHLTEEHDMLSKYEKKVQAGASFIAVHLPDAKDKVRVSLPGQKRLGQSMT